MAETNSSNLYSDIHSKNLTTPHHPQLRRLRLRRWALCQSAPLLMLSMTTSSHRMLGALPCPQPAPHLTRKVSLHSSSFSKTDYLIEVNLYWDYQFVIPVFFVKSIFASLYVPFLSLLIYQKKKGSCKWSLLWICSYPILLFFCCDCSDMYTCRGHLLPKAVMYGLRNKLKPLGKQYPGKAGSLILTLKHYHKTGLLHKV